MNKDPHTKYSQYIMDNYFFISFKVAVAIGLINLGLADVYENIKKKFKDWRSKKNVSSSRRASDKQPQDKNYDSDLDMNPGDDTAQMSIVKFVRKMNKTNSDKFDL